MYEMQATAPVKSFLYKINSTEIIFTLVRLQASKDEGASLCLIYDIM